MRKCIVLASFFLHSLVLLAQRDYTQLVNPLIGTGGHGHTYPGATFPFGAVQLSPDTRLKGWDGCSGYHYSDSAIYGFSHTHLNGTGIEDYCDVLLQPTTGPLQWNNEEYKSPFSHQQENASAGYYAVNLEKYDIDVELTSTMRTGLHKYTFPNGTKVGNILIDLLHRDVVLDSWLEQVDAFTLRGMRQSRSWANKQTLYFVIRFSKPIKHYTVALNDKVTGDLPKAQGKNIKAYGQFDVEDGVPLMVKVGLSGVSADGALKNLEAEQQGFDFSAVLAKTKAAWNTELGKINVEGGTKDDQTNFYTALYHSNINPNTYMDVDGQYRGTDDKIHLAKGFTNYTVFSLWDTYRAYHPLMTIINQQRTADWINTFLAQDQYGGMLPVWELSGNETFCMIGYHSTPVIADAYLKGIKGFDGARALKAMTRYAEGNRFGLPYYAAYGYLGNDKEAESVSKTLEYAYDDWCIAQMAKALGEKGIYSKYMKRAQHYKNLFDPSTKHIRGKLGAMWYSPFDPKEINHFYTEGNSWQYSFAVPQDITGLINLYGGREAFAARLNQLFTTDAKMTGRDQADVTGLIGQYAHGNEPSHHMAYLFHYIGQPWQTQYYLHKILTDFYKNSPDGLIGNEDCGQMSAWYIFSAIGFYPVNPCSGQYVLGAPLFDKVTIRLENGKQFVVQADRAKPGDYYVHATLLNGRFYSPSYISHHDLMKGGELKVMLNMRPNKKWGSAEKDWPHSAITEDLITPVPYFKGADKKFKGSTRVGLGSIEKGTELFYAVTTLGKKAELNNFKPYRTAITIAATGTVHAYALKGGQKSKFIAQDFYRIPEDKTIEVKSMVNPLYTAGGPDALIDGITGDANYRTGEWQSYEGSDFEALVDLKSVKTVHFIGANFLQDVGNWIWMPTEVSFEVSEDAREFRSAGKVKNTVGEQNYEATVMEFGLQVSERARYIRIKALNYGTIPDWHPGKGGKAHIFIDEVMVR